MDPRKLSPSVLLRGLAPSALRSARRHRAKASPHRLGLEPLESRELLSTTYYVSPTGSDTNAGSAAAPFQTLQKAANLVAAGDTVIARAGTYSSGFILSYDTPTGGTASAPITFEADPSAPAGSVIITGRENKTPDAIDLEEGSNYVTIKGFTINNASGSITRAGIRVAGGTTGVQVLNNNVDHAGTWDIFSSFANNMLIQGNTASHAQSQHGIYVSNSAVAPIVRGNTIFGNKVQGLHLNGDVSQGGSGVITNAVIEDNVIFGNGSNGINGDGLQNSTIQNNLIYGNVKHGISLYQIDASAGSSGNTIVNNTIAQNGSSGYAIQVQDSSTGNKIFNNILLGGNSGGLSISSDSLSGTVSDYNVGGGFLSGQDAHSISAPAGGLFVNAGGGNYQLAASSPALNNGIGTLSGQTAPVVDMLNAARPLGGAWDMGAYEMPGSAPVIPPPASDTTAPSVASILSTGVTTSTATIGWITNEASSSQVEYGTSSSYGTATTLDGTMATTHSVALSGLPAGTVIHYRVKSADAAGNLAVSSDNTLTTASTSTSTGGTTTITTGHAYYVSPTGNDGNAGTSAAPLQTLQKAANLVVAGDTVIAEPGTYSAGFVLGWDVPTAGTAVAPITFEADPNAPAGSVVITGREGKTPDGIDLEAGSDYVVVKGFTINNASGSITRAGIRVAGGSTGVQIVNNNVDHAGTWDIYSSFANNLLIQGNTASHAQGQHGIYVSNSAVAPIIRGNTIFGNAVQGLHLNGDVSQGGTGMITNAVIEDNTIFGNGSNGINGDGVENSRIQNNLIYGNVNNGISLYQIDAAAGSSGNTIANNTIAQTGSAGWSIKLQNSSTGNKIFNNILLGGSGGGLSISSDSLPGTVSDYNAGGGFLSGQDAHSISASASALFANAGGGNYQLAASSPALNKGIGTMASQTAPLVDMLNAARPLGGAWDMGAYESPSSVLLPPAGDTTAPNISAVTGSNLTASAATIAWTTNESSDSQMVYGTTSSYGSTSSVNNTMVTSHSLGLTGLLAGTTYHYKVQSRDAAGNLAVSGDYTFTTAPAPVQASTTPSATLKAAPITSPGARYYYFTVVYSDNAAIKTSTISSSNIKVTGPNGYSQMAKPTYLSASSNGAVVSALYRIQAPNGSAWQALNDGTYTVALVSNQVSDSAGNFVPGAVLGTFKVTI